MTTEDDKKVKLAERWFWPDWRFVHEDRMFALRCAESFRNRLKPKNDD